ncbi:MAG: hypothetical protein IKB29_03585 [Clostridia bacterium]|nr:hypothetical protein [Clostridia bacterium]
MNNKITNDIRSKFKSLQSERNLSGIIEYLSSILSAGNDDNMLAGFCYWNISDSYAMLRKSEELYANHFNFCKLLDNMNTKYKLWAVCDATQRFTLELGGFSNFWWEHYENAVALNLCTTDTERILFDTHAAALSINPKVEIPKTRLYLASDNLERFIDNFEKSENIVFYKLVYSSLLLKFFGDEKYDIINLCNELVPLLKNTTYQSGFVTGEWELLNSPRSKKNMAQVGINRAINALIDSNKKAQAKELYTEALKNGLNANMYIEKRI